MLATSFSDELSLHKLFPMFGAVIGRPRSQPAIHSLDVLRCQSRI